MTIEKMRVLAEKNTIGIPNIIYLKANEAETLGKEYESICKELNIEGKICYSDKEGACLSYDREEISTYIIKAILQGENKDNIKENTRELIKNDWSYDLRKTLESKNSPYIKIDEENIKVGYGVNGYIVNKNSYIKNKEQATKHREEELTIPIIAITGTNGKTTTSRLIHKTLLSLGYKSGLSSTGGIYIGDKAIKLGDTTGYYSALEVLKNNNINAAVLETARGGLIKKGLGFKAAKAGIITSLSEDHMGMEGVNDLHSLGKIKALIKEGLEENGVMIVRAIKEITELFTPNDKLILFENEKNELIEKHIQNGGEAFYVENDFIILDIGGNKEHLVSCNELGFAHYGASKSNIRNIMAAIGAIKTFHSNTFEIVNAIKNLKCDMETNKGRQNVIDIKDFKLIIDYGHNSEAFHEVFNIAKSFNPSKITGIITAAGDRKDDYITELGEIAASYCNRIIIKEHNDRRGREIGETSKLLLKGVKNKGFKDENIKVLLKEEDAIIDGVKNAIKGEVVVSFSQFLNQTMPVLNEFIETSKAN